MPRTTTTTTTIKKRNKKNKAARKRATTTTIVTRKRGSRPRRALSNSSSMSEMAWRVAFPINGDSFLAPAIDSEVNVIAFVAMDSFVLSADQFGNGTMVILPNFVSTTTNNLWNNSTITGPAGFFNLFYYNSAGTSGLDSSGNIQGSPTSSYAEGYLTGQMGNSTPSTGGEFARARIEGISVEIIYMGNTLYDQGFKTIQIFDPMSRVPGSNTYIQCPLNYGTVTPTFSTGALRSNAAFSVPKLDHLSNVLSLPIGSSSGFLGSSTGIGLWPGIEISVTGAYPAAAGSQVPCCRVIVRRLISAEPQPYSGFFSLMGNQPPEMTPAFMRTFDSLVAHDEFHIAYTLPGMSALDAIAEKLGHSKTHRKISSTVARGAQRNLKHRRVPNYPESSEIVVI